MGKKLQITLEAKVWTSPIIYFSVFDGFVFHPQAVKKEYQAVNLL